MYAAPKIYDDMVVAEPQIAMYTVSPIYSDLETSSSGDIDARQDKCLSELEVLQQRVANVQVCANLTKQYFANNILQTKRDLLKY